MRKWKFLLILAILSSLFAFSVYADTTEADHDGYILKFKNTECIEIAMEYIKNSGILAGEGEVISEIYDPDFMYKAYDEKLIAFFEKLGLLEYSEPDALCHLFDYDYDADWYYKNYQSSWAHECSNAPGAW